MSVLVRGIEMPKSCHKCFIKQGSCPAIRKRIQVLPTNGDIWIPYNYRYDDCPLWGVSTPHGDLIDAFAFRREMDTNYPFDKFTQSKYGEADAAKSTILMMLGKAPTIIKAEEQT